MISALKPGVSVITVIVDSFTGRAVAEHEADAGLVDHRCVVLRRPVGGRVAVGRVARLLVVLVPVAVGVVRAATPGEPDRLRRRGHAVARASAAAREASTYATAAATSARRARASTSGQTNAVARASACAAARRGAGTIIVAPSSLAAVELREAGLELGARSRPSTSNRSSGSFAIARWIARSSRSGTVGPHVEHARRRLVHVPHRDRDEVVAREGHLAAQQLVEHDAERVDVRLRDRPLCPRACSGAM